MTPTYTRTPPRPVTRPCECGSTMELVGGGTNGMEQPWLRETSAAWLCDECGKVEEYEGVDKEG